MTPDFSRQQEFRNCKAGADRGGAERTWPEVGQIMGVSADYARRVANAKLGRLPKVVRCDPREVIPELKTVVTDEVIAEWMKDPYCLCGCGEPTFQESSNRGKYPIGAFRAFKGSHEKRMPWFISRMAAWNADLHRRQAISHARRAKTISSVMVKALVAEYRAAHSLTSGQFAEMAGMSQSWIADLCAGRYPRIATATAGRIFAAIGEPMRPEIATAYKNWATINGVTPKEVTVVRE